MSRTNPLIKSTSERIGSKVRHLRNSRGLTQKELAGDTVSRNMLSMIESGNALPSLETLMHISDVLGIPPGYFLAEGDEELMYGKREALGTILDLIKDKKYTEAASLCESFSDSDAELRLYFTMCHLSAAKEFLDQFMLTSADEHLNLAMKSSKNLPFGDEYVSQVCTFIRILTENVSLDSVPDISPIDFPLIPASFLAYLTAYKAYRSEDLDCADGISRSGLLGRFHTLHVRGAVLMANGDFDGATRMFDLALSSDDGGFYSRYKLICDLELCRKNAGDFEAAYSLSTSRMEMLGMFAR